MHKLILKILLSLPSIMMFSQSIQVYPEWIDIEKGLSQGHISSFVQDKEGFLWMGTKDGLNRYDGEHFEIFTEDIEDPYSITGNYIQTIHDDDGFMLVATYEALNVFDKETKRFYKIPFDTGDTKFVITSIIKDEFNQYWLAELNTGALYKLTLSSNFLKKIRLGNQISELLSIKRDKNVNHLYPFFVSKYKDDLLVYVSQIKKENGIWEKHFNTFNTITGEVLEINSKPFDFIHYRYKFLVSNNSIVLSFWGEKNLEVYKNNEWEKIDTDFTIKTISHLKERKQILIEDDSRYLIFDETILEKNTINEKDADLIVLKTKANHTCWLQDKSGNYWIGTNGYGVVKVGHRQSKIKTYFTGKSIYAKPFILSGGDIYIGNPTTQERLFIQKTEQGIARLKQFANITEGLCDLVEDNTGTIWGLYWEKGYYKIAKEIDGQIIDIKVINQSTYTVPPILYYDAVDHKIVLVSNSEITIYNINEDQIETYNYSDQFGPHIHRYIITRTPNGNYWIGTNVGMIRAVIKNGKVVFKLFNKGNGLHSNEVASLYPDIHDENILWIGTKGGGLHRLDITDMSFDYVNSKNGLPNDVIYSVLEDENNTLWMSSNLGLISYHKHTKEIRNFKKSDGLQSNEFNTYAYAKSFDGNMYFGGINGLNSFNPSDLDKNQNLPEIWITGLEVNNKEIKYEDTSGLLSKSIEYAEDITLPYEQNNIALSFAAIEYTASDKNNFSYYLEGAEKEWVHTTTENKANYLNIAPGNYIFKIKAANGDGIWNDDVKHLKITILAPWYKTNIAYAMYILAGIIILLLIIKTREDKIKSREQIEKSKLENKLLNQKLENNKSELKRFTNLLLQNSEETEALHQELEKLKKETQNTSFTNLENLLNTRILTDKQWLLFKEKFTAVYPDFFHQLRNKEYDFSEAEERLLVLEKVNLRPKEIGAILGIAGPSVSRTKHRLKSKLGIDKTVSIIEFLEL
ncbi:ligand-binding sensor domain-containing protein [Aquimarina sp. 2201CG5-10]|uniref:ligand-binding sensor domain-containing protein n=1 Tax=Aquimarina callyspongiae TaxID=3098150 RepID=UPI002AB3DF4E|nr:two-component regulator propeller domain-containing protein [Aquimarina sp. 2201CG5-10]MDY8134329.1 two-component regulator propeller domain-containing protein [Aquimarina sp. 2201CG5-10]